MWAETVTVHCCVNYMSCKTTPKWVKYQDFSESWFINVLFLVSVWVSSLPSSSMRLVAGLIPFILMEELTMSQIITNSSAPQLPT